MKLSILLSVVVIAAASAVPRQQRQFPDDFIFGTATASYQIEGAWDEDGKGENIWDYNTHRDPTIIDDQSNGDVAADSYHNYKRDVEIMRELGLDCYRFSLSWPRILPSGFPNHINQAGVDFYNNYIDEMLKYNIQPIVTLYHWDLPQKLQELGGFTNPLFEEWFEDYARVAYSLFGDRVKLWITFNEPMQICYQGYGSVTKIPQVNATGIGEYLCAKHLVMGHARAYHAYNNDFKPSQGGRCGLAINLQWYMPDTDSEEDAHAVDLMNQAYWALYTDPIYLPEGGFPKELSEIVAKKSAEQGYPRSRMLSFTEDERVYVQGTYDFLGLNQYSGNIVSATKYKTPQAVPSIYDDIDVGWTVDETWLKGQGAVFYLVPNSLYNCLTLLRQRYNDPDIYVTESGWSGAPDASLIDEDRVTYYATIMEQMLDAIDEGVKLKGYMAWSLLDNFEWMRGYTERFGLYAVDFSSPERTRTPRLSAFFYKEVLRTRTAVAVDYRPEEFTMKIDEGLWAATQYIRIGGTLSKRCLLTAAMQLLVLLSLAVLGSNAASVKQERRFPDDFLFGTATASYQIEGAWNEDGKGESIWDHMTHNKPHVIKEQTNGDIADDTYHNYKRDVEMMRELGLDAYRFSLSWSRILPTGFPSQVNQAGVDFYNNYIDEMLKYNIKPMVTLYHWDLPQKLQELGGFTNPLFIEWFEDYARVVFAAFGDRVKHWITFNEPREICYEGYGWTTKAPQLNATGIGEYLCAKHLVVAHAKAYHAYNNDFKPSQGGQCGITISTNYFAPMTDSEEDKAAAELLAQSQWVIYAEPIFSEQGGFPKELTERVAAKSKEQGYPRSRLPELTEEEIALVKGASDFYGVNHYTSILVSASDYKEEHPVPGQMDDADAGMFVPDEWPKSASVWLNQAPRSLYNALTDVHKRYSSPEIYVTENGWSSHGGLQDDDRVRYYRAALADLLDVLDEGVQLKGYMAWSLMDNFEWMEGYTERFGLYEVDFESAERTRTARKSALVYKHIIANRVIDPDYEPENLNISIDEGH
ncbi:lactase/phlorizin hydrolase-like [Cydia splendana]|uniref:lactase/phlorizin hydrolase-like n=1 Tax=Cydia splendana TaxID=1100963 RepID=UPI00300D8C3D